MSQANHGRLAKNTLFLYGRLIFTLVLSLFTSRLVLGSLGFEDYGIYNVVAGAILALSFLNGALTTGTQRFLSFELGAGRKAEVGKVFSTALLLHLAMAGVVIILAESIGLWLLNNVLSIPESRTAAANWVFQLALLSFAISIIQVPFMAAIVANERMDLYAYLSILESVIKLGNAYILMFLEADKLVLFGILNVVASVTLAALYGTICRMRFPECRSLLSLSTSRLREMSAFLGWNAFAHIAVAAGVHGVNILLNVFFGPVVNAARGIALLASDSIKQFSGAFQVASAPQITKTFSAGEFEDQRNLILFACKSTFFLLFLVALPVFIESDQVLRVWLQNPPPDSALFLRLVLVDALICTSANPMYYAIMATGDIGRYQLIGGLINLGNFAACFILLAAGFPAYIVFYVLIVVSILMLGLRLWFLRRKIRFSIREYSRRVIVPGALVVAASSILPVILLINLEEGIARLLTVSVFGFVSTISVIYMVGLNSQEREFMSSRVKEQLRRLRRA